MGLFQQRGKSMARFAKIAHRGASGNFPENTRVAFEKAIEAHSDVIELDCQLTRDGHVVVFHDEHLRRIARCDGAVRERTLDQLKDLDIGSWRKKAHRGQRILTLEEAFDIIGGRVDVCVDIKQFAKGPEGIELKLLFIVSHYDYLDRTIFSSFDYRCLERVRELAPESRIGVICDAATQQDPIRAARELDAVSIHAEKRLATRDFLGRAWQEGLDVYVWTINEIREMAQWVSLGVQGLISDFPERFAKIGRF
jgi:glycerophosphoryl diester phosphodiesterase